LLEKGANEYTGVLYAEGTYTGGGGGEVRSGGLFARRAIVGLLGLLLVVLLLVGVEEDDEDEEEDEEGPQTPLLKGGDAALGETASVLSKSLSDSRFSKKARAFLGLSGVLSVEEETGEFCAEGGAESAVSNSNSLLVGISNGKEGLGEELVDRLSR